jgi:hypothetical protein
MLVLQVANATCRGLLRAWRLLLAAGLQQQKAAIV